MAEIVIRVGAGDDFDEENRVDTDRETQATVSLDVRKTLGGDLVVYDHEDVTSLYHQRQRLLLLLPKTRLAISSMMHRAASLIIW